MATAAILETPPDPLEDGQRTPHVQCPVTGLTTTDTTGLSCPVSHLSLSPSTSFDNDVQEIDPILLRTDLDSRMVYLKDFLNFSRKDQEVIHKVAPLVNDIIPDVVDKLYAKLFEFDITKQVFLERNEGFDGPLPTRLEDLTLDSPQIIFRKIFMKNWARRVLTSDYTSGKTWQYMDKVGIMHTGVKSFKHRNNTKPLVVPYRDCALTLGWVQTVLQTAILQLPDNELRLDEKTDAIAAINKVIWIQNDLFSRHYIGE